MKSQPLSLFAALVLVTACSDDGSRVETSTSGVTLPDTSGSTAVSSSSSGNASAPTTSSATTEASGVTDGGTSSGVTSEPGSSGTSSGSSGPVSASSTDGTTGVVSTTGDTSSSTTAACVCTPGEVNGCDGNAVSKCAADCLGFEPSPCAQGEKCSGGVCTALFCAPQEEKPT